MSGGGLKYVKDFDFPSEQGFSGSAGKSEVKGYMRGGAVKNKSGKANARKAAKKPTVKAAMGGSITNAQKTGYMPGGETSIEVDGIGITVPKMKGGAVHNKLLKHGKQMGYKQGGQVKVRGLKPGSKSIGQSPDDIGLKNYKPRGKKNTSGEFKMKKGKQGTMDTGVQPARRGRTQQEIEAGGTKRLKPGFSKGGEIKGREDSGGGALADAALKGAKAAHRARPRKPMKKPERVRAASAKGMPKNVKAAGGPVRRARGGSVKK